jgi:hypothetical protein
MSKRMLGRVLCTLTVVMIAVSGVYGAQDTADVTTAVQLQYSGGSNALVDKTVWNITSAGTAWTLAVATGTTNECVFGCVANGTRVSLDNHWTNGNYGTSYSSFSLTEQTYMPLKQQSDGSQVQMTSPSSNQDVWFKIDVPDDVSSSDQQTIQVRFRATTQ